MRVIKDNNINFNGNIYIKLGSKASKNERKLAAISSCVDGDNELVKRANGLLGKKKLLKIIPSQKFGEKMLIFDFLGDKKPLLKRIIAKKHLPEYQKKVFANEKISSLQFVLSQSDYLRLKELKNRFILFNFFSITEFENKLKRVLNTQNQEKWLTDFFTPKNNK